MRGASLFFAILLGREALACASPPAEQSVAPEALIARSRNIVLADVIKAELQADYKVLYTFREVTRLRGESVSTFTLVGRPAIWGGATETFDNHSKEVFWSAGRGRTPNEEDCEIHPDFAVGGTYLLFLDKPYHVKGFELIIRTHGDASKKDKWLQFVESHVSR